MQSRELASVPNDMSKGATFTFEPPSTDLVHNHLCELLPGGKKPSR